jgi:hypothetical protein
MLDLTPVITPDASASLPLLHPGDGGYDAARAAWNLAINHRPAAGCIATEVSHVQGAAKADTRPRSVGPRR